MLEASTSGHGQHKNKTINAEVNLLSEWMRQRDTLGEQITRTAVVLIIFTLLTFGSAPFLLRAFFESASRVHGAQVVFDGKTAALATNEQKKLAATPKLDQGAMHDTVVREAKQFLGQTMLVLNASGAGMAFGSVRADVVSGDLTINCSAVAESNSVVQTFLDHAAQGPNVKSTLLRTAQPDKILAPEGVAFEYVKGVEVSP
jgi:hypothetical protein